MTTKTRHTPGPWTYSAGPYRVVVERDCAETPDPERYRPHTVADLGPVEAWGNDRTRANARLIAQAPVMADLLRALVERAGATPMLWEKSLDAPERKANELRNYVLGNARAILAAIEGGE